MPATYRLRWRSRDDDRYHVSHETKDAIVHGIDGLDPHKPVFHANRCNLWSLWYCTKLLPDGRVSIRPPWVPQAGPVTGSLHNLLHYHRTGEQVHPVTSFRHPCPNHPNRTYGHCCFPTILTTCDTHGLCVNPLHFRVGVTRDVPVGSDDTSSIVCPPAETCDVCKWDPCTYRVTDKVTGHDLGHCLGPVALGPHSATVWKQWRREAVLERLNTLDPASDAYTATRRYMDRFCTDKECKD